MSISNFTASLRTAAGQAVATKLLTDFKNSAEAAFNKKTSRGTPDKMFRAASIISKGMIAYTDSKGNEKKYSLAEQFRDLGNRFGFSRFTVTEDNLNQIFSTLGIPINTPPIILYVKYLAEQKSNLLARHFEIYLRDKTVIDKNSASIRRASLSTILQSINVEEIIAIKYLKISHTTTMTEMARFLSYINAYPGRSVDNIVSEILGPLFHRGHLYAQTTGRALVSAKDIAGEDNIINDIINLYKLLDEGSSSLSNDKYSEVKARALKDFTGNELAMNLEIQLIEDDNGTGNALTGKLSQQIQIVNFLQKLITNSLLSKDGKRQLAILGTISLKEFEKELNNLSTKLTKYSNELNKVLSSTSNPTFLANLQTSKSMKNFLIDSTIAGYESKKVAGFKSNTGFVPIIKRPSIKTNISKKLDKAINIIKNDVSKIVKASTPKIKQTSTWQPTENLFSLQSLINSKLHDQIKANMGTGNERRVLNYRTGRFAKSAKVEKMSESRAGMITAFYSYMKYPYATFSEGGRQSSPRTRDPKLLISKSIREIAADKVANRLRAVAL